MPDFIAGLIGVKDVPNSRVTLQFFGVREIAARYLILSQPDPSAGVWARSGGDALDLAALGAAYNADGADKGRVAGALVAVAGVSALDVLCANQLAAKGA